MFKGLEQQQPSISLFTAGLHVCGSCVLFFPTPSPFSFPLHRVNPINIRPQDRGEAGSVSPATPLPRLGWKGARVETKTPPFPTAAGAGAPGPEAHAPGRAARRGGGAGGQEAGGRAALGRGGRGSSQAPNWSPARPGAGGKRRGRMHGRGEVLAVTAVTWEKEQSLTHRFFSLFKIYPVKGSDVVTLPGSLQAHAEARRALPMNLGRGLDPP